MLPRHRTSHKFAHTHTHTYTSCILHTHLFSRPHISAPCSDCEVHLTEFEFLTCHVFACLPVELLKLQSDTISGACHIGVCVRLWMRACQAVSSECPSEHGFHPLSNAYGAVCLYICLSAPWMSAYRSISLRICLPPHLLVCTAAFQPSCLGPLLAGDKLASWQPEAICHPCSLFCSASVSCLLLLGPILVCPTGPTCNPLPLKKPQKNPFLTYSLQSKIPKM